MDNKIEHCSHCNEITEHIYYHDEIDVGAIIRKKIVVSKYYKCEICNYSTPYDLPNIADGGVFFRFIEVV